MGGLAPSMGDYLGDEHGGRNCLADISAMNEQLTGQ
jgi:hypothetical protein